MIDWNGLETTEMRIDALKKQKSAGEYKKLLALIAEILEVQKELEARLVRLENRVFTRE